MAMIHRLLFTGTEAQDTATQPMPRAIDVVRESMWIAFCSLDRVDEQHLHHLCHFSAHHRLAFPVAPWERLKMAAALRRS
jgi:hypothetical protein